MRMIHLLPSKLLFLPFVIIVQTGQTCSTTERKSENAAIDWKKEFVLMYQDGVNQQSPKFKEAMGVFSQGMSDFGSIMVFVLQSDSCEVLTVEQTQKEAKTENVTAEACREWRDLFVSANQLQDFDAGAFDGISYEVLLFSKDSKDLKKIFSNNPAAYSNDKTAELHTQFFRKIFKNR